MVIVKKYYRADPDEFMRQIREQNGTGFENLHIHTPLLYLIDLHIIILKRYKKQ